MTTAIDIWKAVFWVLVHGTVLAAVAWVLSETLLRRARPAVIAALWTVVLVKFIVPVGPAMPWSLSTLIDGFAGGGTRLYAAYALPDMKAAAPAATAADSISIAGIAAIAGLALWAVAVAFLAVWRVRAHVAARRIARSGSPARPELIALVAAVARRLGLRRAPDVRISDESAVPWVVGLRRPILVVPAALADGPINDLSAVVGHELAHLRRRDAWLRLVQVVAGTLFFFWPVVRWASRRVDDARELACDAWAIARGPLAAPEYARVLVRTARLAAVPAPAAALGLAAHPHFLARRVEALLAGHGRRPPRAGVGVGGVALLAVWVVVSLGGAARADTRTAPKLGKRSADCMFTPELAAEILATHPEADLDGDGNLTRNEACDFQLEWALLSTELPAAMVCGEVEDRCTQE